MDTSYCDDSLMGVSIAIMPTQIVLVAGRFYTRRVQEIACTADDYLMIPAVASLPAPRLVGYMFFNTLCFADRKPRSVGIVYSVYDAYCDLISARLTGQVLNIAGLGYQFEYVQQTAPEKLVSLQKVACPYSYLAASTRHHADQASGPLRLPDPELPLHCDPGKDLNPPLLQQDLQHFPISRPIIRRSVHLVRHRRWHLLLGYFSMFAGAIRLG